MKNTSLKLILILTALALSIFLLSSCDIGAMFGGEDEDYEPSNNNVNSDSFDEDYDHDPEEPIDDSEAGLYESGSDFKNQLKTWEELVNEGIIEMDGDVVSHCDPSISGDLVITKTASAIGNHAFTECDGLVNVKIPGEVKDIKYGAFYNCKNLESVDFGKGVVRIEESAFDWCSKLESINLPRSVKSVANAFFACYALESIEVDSKNTAYKSIDGNLYTKDGSMIVQYALAKEDVSFVLPEDTTAVGNYAFASAKNLQTVLLSDGVESIGTYAFNECTNLGSIYLGESLVSIGGGAFVASGICEIVLPDTVESIAAFAFAGCANLERVTVSSALKNMDEGVFAECRMLKEFVANEDNEAFEAVDGILYSEDLTTLVAYPPAKPDMAFQIPYSVDAVGNFAFYDCDNLNYIYLHNTIDSVGIRAFFDCSSVVNIDIPYGVKEFGDGALGSCDAMVSITIPNSIEKLGSDVFMWNVSLRDIYFDGSLEEWDQIEKGEEWVDGTRVLYSVHCNDGDVFIPGN